MVHLTHSTKPVREKEIKRIWHHFDAKGKVVGRLASQIAQILIGKDKANYVTYLDVGDNVVVTNAREVVLTGRKADNKTYSRYSGYPGGLKVTPFKTLKESRPEEIIRHAVMGMLPKNKLRDKRITRLHVYKDDKHPHEEKFKSQNSKSQIN